MPHASLTSIASAFRRSEAFLLLCVQVAVLHVGQSLLTPILPLYAQTFAVGATLIGFLLTSQSLPRIFVNLPTGRLADRWGAHRLLVVAAAVVTLSAIGGGLAPTYALFLVTRLLQGVGTGISQTAGFTYAVAVSQPATRARYISLYQGSFLLGNGMGPLIGGVTAQYLGYRAPFFAYAFLGLIVGIWIYLRLPDPRRRGEQHLVPHSPEVTFLNAAGTMLRHRGVLLASSIGLLGAITRSASRNMAIPLRGDEIGLTESQIGLALSAVFIMTFIALYLVGAIADRFRRKAIIVPSWLLTAAALTLVALAPSFGLYVLATAGFGLAVGIGGPIPAVYVADAATENTQGIAIGMYRTFGDVGLVIGPLAMGWIIDHASISTGLVINAVIIVLVAVLFWLLAPELKRPEPATVT